MWLQLYLYKFRGLIIRTLELTYLNSKLLFFVFPVQFYKNLSTCLEDVVWKTEEDMQEMK